MFKNNEVIEHQFRHLQEELFDALTLYTKLFHKPFSKEALIAGLAVTDQSSNISIQTIHKTFERAAQRAGLKVALVQRRLDEILDLHLPVLLILKKGHVCILDKINHQTNQVSIIHSQGDGLQEWIEFQTLEKEYTGYAYLIKKAFSYHDKSSQTLQLQQKHWFWDTIKRSIPIYKDVLLASILINLFVLAIPLFTRNVYDRVIPNHAKETLIVFTIGITIVLVLDFVLKMVRAYLLEIAGKKSDIIISSIIFGKVLDLKMDHHPPSVGSFASNLRDFEAVRNFLTNSTLTVLIDIPFSFLFLVTIYYIGGILVLIPIITICLILIYALLIRKPLEISINASHQASAKRNGILIETLQNIETIKTLRLHSKQQWQWEDATGEIAEKNLKSRILSASIPTVTNLLLQLNTVAVVVGGVYLISDYQLTMGGLIAIMILTSRTIAPMGQAAALITNYSDAKMSYEIIDNIISKEMERPEGKEFLQCPKFNGEITFQNVTFSYPNSQIHALQNVSFTIRPQEKVAIIGRIGSGKSTIAKLLLKLYEPSDGKILIDGIDIAQIDPFDVRRQIAYVPQDIALFRGTIKENIITSERHPSAEEIIQAARISGIEAFVKTHPLGYDMPIGERGAGLSGGQRQSVGIARALLKNCPIVVMDEPSNSMDQTTEMALIKSLKEALKDKTVLLITQKASMLELADTIIVMHHSQLYLHGPKEEVLKQLEK